MTTQPTKQPTTQPTKTEAHKAEKKPFPGHLYRIQQPKSKKATN